MNSGGSGVCRSRGRREAMPKPVSLTSPLMRFTRILAGFTSLWTMPRWCSLPNAAMMPMARRRKRAISIGAPSSRSSGSPPESSSTSMTWPRSRTSSSGRTAQARSSSSRNPYSLVRRSTQLAETGSAAGTTARTAVRAPPSTPRQALQKARSPSSHKTGRPPAPSATSREGAFIGGSARCPDPAPSSAEILFLPKGAAKNLVEDDGAESRRADASDRERAKFERQVARRGRQRNADGQQVLWVREVDSVLDPDTPGHRGDQSEHDDRQTAEHGARNGQDEGTEFGREAEQHGDRCRDDEDHRRIDIRCRQDAHVLGVGRHAGAAAEPRDDGRQAIAEKRASEEGIEIASGHHANRFDVSEVFGDQHDRHGSHQEHDVRVKAGGREVRQPEPRPRREGAVVDRFSPAKAVGEKQVEQVAGDCADDHGQPSPQP